MLFVNALFLAAAGTVLGPILFHLLLRNRPKRQILPTLRFLSDAAPQSYAAHRLKNLLLLVLRAAIVVLLVTAFARPYLQREEAAQRAQASLGVVFALDASLSMGASRRWDAARARIETLLGGLPASTPAALVLLDSTPELVVAATTQIGAINAALRERVPGNAATDLVAGLNTAIEVAAGIEAEQKIVYVVSDFQNTGLESSAAVPRGAEGVSVVTVPIDDTRPGNAAILAVRPGRSASGDVSSVLVDLANFDDRDASLPLAITSEGAELGRTSVDLKRNERRSVEVPLTSAAAGERLLEARIENEDALATDNAFVYVLERKEAVALLVIERRGSLSLAPSKGSDFPPGANPYLASALAALGDEIRPAWSDPLSVDAARLATFPVAIIAGGAFEDGFLAMLRGYVSAGGAVIAFPPADQAVSVAELAGAEVDGWTRLDAESEYRLVTSVNPRGPFARRDRSGESLLGHPRALRYVNARPSAGSNAVVLAEFDDGSPFLFERREGAGLFYLFTVPLDSSASDLVLRAAFAPVLYELIAYASDAAKTDRAYTVGEVAAVANSEPTAAPPAAWREPGFHKVIRAGAEFSVAVNIDPAESDLAPAAAERIAALTSSSRAGVDAPGLLPAALYGVEPPRDEAWRIWAYLLVAALILMGGESLLASRTAR